MKDRNVLLEGIVHAPGLNYSTMTACTVRHCDGGIASCCDGQCGMPASTRTNQPVTCMACIATSEPW